MTTWTIRPRTPLDDDRIAEVNAANEPEVGPLDAVRRSLFPVVADVFDVVEIGAAIEGLFVGLTEGVDYASPNYRWFCDRHERFAYVDRIALQPAARGLGIADAWYDAFEKRARDAGRDVVCAEVNVVPANPRSLRFHERRGFVTVEEIAPYGSEERVAMVEKRL